MIENNPFHALICLKSWIEQGEKLIEESSSGPWTAELKKKSTEYGQDSVWINRHMNVMIADVVRGKLQGNGALIAASRSLVPGLIDGMKMLLKKYRLTAKEFGLDHIATRVLRRVILDVARSYEPRMVEAGFLVPDPKERTEE